jgi:hypothetical protein
VNCENCILLRFEVLAKATPGPFRQAKRKPFLAP